MRYVLLTSLLVLLACGDDDRAPVDSGAGDSFVTDASMGDGGSEADVDSGTRDGGPGDAGRDVGVDGGPLNGGQPDVGRDGGTDARPDAPPMGMCPGTDLGMMMGDSVASGSTAGAPSLHDTTCGSSAGGPDATFSWTAPSTGMFAFDTNGSMFDTVLEIRTGSCAGVSLGCNDDGGLGTASLVTLSLTMGQTVVIAVDGYGSASGAYVLSINPSSPEICDNMIDDDRDGDTDCADFDCDALESCHERVCDDGIDDDLDGATDCDDFSDCYEDPACTETGPECVDGADNDGDGSIDCADFDCGSEPDCMETGAQCEDGADNDGDGSIDCDDFDCSGEDACSEFGDECFDGGDNDGDGAIDCADFDCFDECSERGNCTDGRDNDSDGDADCGDMDCVCDPACRGVAPVCPDTDLGSSLGVVASGVLAPGTCGDRTDASCGSGGNGGEIEYMWTAPAAGTYRIDTTDGGGTLTTFDTILSIRDAACDGAELTCNDDSFGLLSSVTVTLTASQVIIIVLEGYSETSSGDYELTITAL